MENYGVTATYSFDDYPDSFEQSLAADRPTFPLNTDKTGWIELGGDVDYIPFDAQIGDQFFATAYKKEARRTNAGLTLLVLGPNQEIITVGVESSRRQQANWQATTVGRHYVVIESGVGRHDYFFGLNLAPDDHPDSINDSSPTLLLPSLSYGKIEVNGDVDVFALNALSGDTINLDSASTNTFPPSSFRMRLLAADGSVLVGAAPQITWDAIEDGQYFAVVSNSTPSTDSLRYSLRYEKASTFDFTGDGFLDAEDLDIVAQAVSSGSSDEQFDLDQSGKVDQQDLDQLLARMETSFGDLNLDGEINFADFLALSASFGREGNWADGQMAIKMAIAKSTLPTFCYSARTLADRNLAVAKSFPQ